MDLGKTHEDYWKPLFAGYDFSKQWLKDNKPDVIFLVYNDHATAFSLDMIPTFAIGTAGAANAALFAASILAAEQPDLRQKLQAWRDEQTAAARAMTAQLPQ